MKTKILLIICALLFLSGCATYSLKKGDYSPYNKGFIVTRYDRVIPEYTLGKDNSIPVDEQVARERFQRRRKAVEDYYKKMGYIENRFRQNFIDPPKLIINTVIGVFRLPSIAIKDYKYNHDPKYKESIDKLEDTEYKAEKERIKALKDRLNAYIQEDLKKEPVNLPAEQKPQVAAAVKEKVEPLPEAKEPVKAEPVVEKPKAASEEVVVSKASEPTAQVTPVQGEVSSSSLLGVTLSGAKGTEAIPSKERIASSPAAPRNDNPQATNTVIASHEVAKQSLGSGPKAVIIAKPQKGPSPLFVQFNGVKSSSPNGRIVSYAWDFGDGDTSTKKNPTNTYWSTTFGSRKYTATLTVKDNKGISAVTSTEIEVITK